MSFSRLPYFFLIGKYGVRVGDRVNIAGVTGDVVDIGLVRLQLMEVTGGPAPPPTGRVVAFSNSVVFQANSGMFKQIPGTNFLWHEITLTLDPKGHYRQVEQRMMEAVNKVFAEYRDRMEVQRRNVERSLNSTIATFSPESRLHLTQTALEVVIRYPVDLEHAGEIDNRVTREILDALERDPSLRLQVSAGPTIRQDRRSTCRTGKKLKHSRALPCLSVLSLTQPYALSAVPACVILSQSICRHCVSIESNQASFDATERNGVVRMHPSAAPYHFL